MSQIFCLGMRTIPATGPPEPRIPAPHLCSTTHLAESYWCLGLLSVSILSHALTLSSTTMGAREVGEGWPWPNRVPCSLGLLTFSCKHRGSLLQDHRDRALGGAVSWPMPSTEGTQHRKLSSAPDLGEALPIPKPQCRFCRYMYTSFPSKIF